MFNSLAFDSAFAPSNYYSPYGDSSYIQLLAFNGHNSEGTVHVTGDDPAYMIDALHPSSSPFFDYFKEFGIGLGTGVGTKSNYSEADIYHVGMTTDEIAAANQKNNTGYVQSFKDSGLLHPIDSINKMLDNASRAVEPNPNKLGINIVIIVVIVGIILIAVGAKSVVK